MPPTPKDRPDRERMRRKALARWEDEGGAGPCGPQVPGVDGDCAEEESMERKAGDACE